MVADAVVVVVTDDVIIITPFIPDPPIMLTCVLDEHMMQKSSREGQSIIR